MKDEIKEILNDFEIRYPNKTKILLDYITNLQQENRLLKIDTYKSRNEKTIKYIKENGIIDLNGYDLLNILQGEDKE